MTIQRSPIQFPDSHRFGSIPKETESPYYPYTLKQDCTNPALRMTHLRMKNQMLDKTGYLVRLNYKWLKRLGLTQQDTQFVNNLKRLRNQKRLTRPTTQQPAKTTTVTATVEDNTNYN